MNFDSSTLHSSSRMTAGSGLPRWARSWWCRVVLVGGAVAAGSMFFAPYFANVATSWLIFGLLGLSLDIVWGRMGFLSLGQTAFYGIGGYLGSLAAINLGGDNPSILLWALPAGVASGALAAALIGWIIFYGRMGTLQGTILTYTAGLLMWTGTVSLNATVGQAVIGGDNGMSNIPSIAFVNNASVPSARAIFVGVLTIVLIVYLVVQLIMRSPFGMVIDCVRLNEQKAELLGYDVRRYQLAAFCLSGSIAGLAGALYGGWATYLSPSIFSVQEALLVPIYVLVGGIGTLAGPFVGALAIGGLSFWLGGGAAGGQTTLVMGAALIGLVLFMRGGLLGALTRRRAAALNIRAGADNGDASEQSVRIDAALLAQLMKSGPAWVPSVSLETHDIVKRFGGVVPVGGVTQSFSAGRVRCLIGPNGAGKSSYLRCCTGVFPVDQGRITLAGRDITRAKTFERIREGVGIKLQAPQVFGDLSVRANLWIAAYSATRERHRADEVTEKMLAMLAMMPHAERLAGDLSHGEQQWLDIGMVLCLAPKVIFLDEPAAGMTGADRRELSALIRILSASIAVVVVEHDMEFIKTLNANVTVLHQGQVFAEGDIDTLRQDERILDIYLGRRKHVRHI
ncbi:ABC transporter permease subunit [Paraburkholderia fungorum]|uniref:ABC transporter permease subunit n=1 Tax=Paraburkholderia fungorum TaxID=134537 RepID=UPI0038BC663A